MDHRSEHQVPRAPGGDGERQAAAQRRDGREARGEERGVEGEQVEGPGGAAPRLRGRTAAVAGGPGGRLRAAVRGPVVAGAGVLRGSAPVLLRAAAADAVGPGIVAIGGTIHVQTGAMARPLKNANPPLPDLQGLPGIADDHVARG